MTPQDVIYWIPITLGLIGIFLTAMPFGMDQIMDSSNFGWFILCLAGSGGVCIPIIQWFVLALILVMNYKIITKTL